MTHDRKLALVAGVLYLATFVTSMPALALKTPFLDSGAHPLWAAWGSVLEVLLAAACVGTAVVLYPVTRRGSEPLGLAFVASRTIEAALILVGVLAVLSLLSLRNDAVATATASAALTELHTYAFLLGPAVMSATNALLLGTVLYRTRLVPRVIPAVGLVGGPLLLVSSAGVMLGAWTQMTAIGTVAALPVAAWEFALGIWLVAKGFRPEALAALPSPVLSPTAAASGPAVPELDSVVAS